MHCLIGFLRYLEHCHFQQVEVTKAAINAYCLAPYTISLHNKTENIIKTKLESVPLSCKSHRSKTANIKMLFANSKHIRWHLHL